MSYFLVKSDVIRQLTVKVLVTTVMVEVQLHYRSSASV